MVEIICTIISGLTAIAVAVLSIKLQRVDKKNKELIKRSDERAEKRKKESLLCLEMLNATLDLSIVSANALLGGHNNGNVEEARKAAKKAKEEYEKFLHELIAEDMITSS